MEHSAWITSSYSNGNGGNNCVEAAFVTSTRSGAAGHCVAVSFAKSTRSGPNTDACVEVGFAKSAASLGNGTCVDVAKVDVHEDGCNCGVVTVDGKTLDNANPGDVLVRDTKDNGAGPIIIFTQAQWAELLAQFAEFGMEWPKRGTDGSYVIEKDDVRLSFTRDEWDAFVAGVNDGEFDPM